jgi:hypothetical protein
VYIGGLGDDADDLSPHLRSRHDVGSELAAGHIPVTELRAAIILGAGSASFEMLRSLVEVLPVMIAPRWVTQTRVQPIAIVDLLTYLVAAIDRGPLGGAEDGPDRWSRGDRGRVARRGVVPRPDAHLRRRRRVAPSAGRAGAVPHALGSRRTGSTW